MKMLVRAGICLSAVLLSAPAATQLYDQNSKAMFMPGTKLTGSLSAAGTSASINVRGNFNFSLWGTFSASCELDRSFDGTTWIQLTALGTGLAWTGAATETLSEPEASVAYRVNCPTVTSGTVTYRISQ